MTGPVPLTLLAGFLGSGKTTLLNRVLREQPEVPTAVIVNEFGEVGIDGRLVVAADEEEVVELRNGCLCCTVREDLAEALERLLRARSRRTRRAPFERVLVEGSGLASPGPVLQTLALDPRVAGHVEARGVVTLAHAKLLPRQLVDHTEAVLQVAHATRVLLNHADTCDAGELAAAGSAVERLNPLAEVRTSVRADVPLEWLFTPRRAEIVVHDEHPHGTHPGPTATAVVLRSTAPLDLFTLKTWLRFVAERRGQALYRTKGIVRCVGEEAALAVQGLEGWLEIEPLAAPPPPESVLVLIGRELDEAELDRGWRACER